MSNSENIPIFVDSTLKVTATEDINITDDLNIKTPDNQSIEDLFKKDQNEAKEKE